MSGKIILIFDSDKKNEPGKEKSMTTVANMAMTF